MLGLSTQSGSSDDEEERHRQTVRWRRQCGAVREERQVTTEVVLGLFWSDFGSTKYREECMEDGR